MSEHITPSTTSTNAASATQASEALTEEQSAWLKQYIRSIPDYPQSGILFRDITPLLQDPSALKFSIETMAKRYRGAQIDQVVGIESRGFIFGTPLAYLLGTG